MCIFRKCKGKCIPWSHITSPGVGSRNLQGSDLLVLAIARGPDDARPVEAGRRQPLPARRPAQRADRPVVRVLEDRLADPPPAPLLPDPHGLVAPARRQDLAGRRPPHTPHLICAHHYSSPTVLRQRWRCWNGPGKNDSRCMPGLGLRGSDFALPKTRTTQTWRETKQENVQLSHPCQPAASCAPLSERKLTQRAPYGRSDSNAQRHRTSYSAPVSPKPGAMDDKMVCMGLGGAEEACTRSVCPARSPTSSSPACIFQD